MTITSEITTRAGEALCALLLLTLGTVAADAAQLKVLYHFNGTPGSQPYAGLVEGPDGSLYGMATFGGGSINCTGGCGTVFRLSPPTPPSQKWKYTVLYRFTATNDGAWPTSKLILHKGSLYGTTPAVGGFGTAFRLSPQGEMWKYRKIHQFTGGNGGSNPQAELMVGADGNLYGTTAEGGTNSAGTVFMLAKPATFNGVWPHTVLHSFEDSAGSFSRGALVQDEAGVLFGTTRAGGANGIGTVFELKKMGANWKHRVLRHLTASDGNGPSAGLTKGSNNLLYGTAEAQGSNGGGTVFSLTRSGANPNQWLFKVIFNFNSPMADGDGKYPRGGVTVDPDGVLFGTTYSNSGGAMLGTAYQLTKSGNKWTHKVLKNFAGAASGSSPEAAPIVGADGALYGTTPGGGSQGIGTIYRILP